jgi:hypothetical protein
MSNESKNNIVEKIVDIIYSPEIEYLIKTKKNITFEISIPLLESDCESHYDKIESNNVILETNNKSFENKCEDLERNEIIVKKSSTGFRNDILNGICRQTNLKKNTKQYYEERCYVIKNNLSNIFIITIRNQCSSELLPSIVDYDQSYEYYENLYNINNINNNSMLRKNGSSYDIFNNFDPQSISEQNYDIFIKECTDTLTNLMTTHTLIK